MAVREFRNFLEPIWSIPEGGKALYFTIFTATAATGIGCQVYYHCRAVPSGTQSVHDAVHLILLDTGPTAIGAAMVSLIIVEAPKSIMVIATYLANRLLHPLQEKLRQEGSQRNQAQWEAWNERRMEADKRGEPFDEPPPGKEPEN